MNVFYRMVYPGVCIVLSYSSLLSCLTRVLSSMLRIKESVCLGEKRDYVLGF